MHCETTNRPPSIAPNSTATKIGSTSANSTALEPRWRVARDRLGRRQITEKLYRVLHRIGSQVSCTRCATHSHTEFLTSDHPRAGATTGEPTEAACRPP